MTEAEREHVFRIHASSYRLLDEMDRVCKKHGIPYYLAYGGLLGAVRYGDFIPWDDDVDVILFVDDYYRLRQVKDEFRPPFQFVEPEDYGEKSYDMVPRLNDTSLRILRDGSPTSRFYDNGLRDYAALDIFLINGMPGGLRGLVHKIKLAFWYGVADTFRNQDREEQKTGLMKLAQTILHGVGRFTSMGTVRKRFWREIGRYKPVAGMPLAVENDTLHGMGQLFTLEQFAPPATVQMKDRRYSAPNRYKEVLQVIYGDDYMTPPPPEEQHPSSMYK